MTENRIITVVRDPRHPLGKQFERAANGTITKKSAVNLSFGLAVQHVVETPEAMAALLTQVSEDPHAAVINSGFKDIPIGEEFVILSSREMERVLNISANDRQGQLGVKTVRYDGRQYKAVGRFKENTFASACVLFDRDIDKYTPKTFADLSTEQWLNQVDKILPGVKELTYVETPSTSSRVLDNGKPVGRGNSHVWILVRNPDVLERLRGALLSMAARQNMTWQKPRYSRTNSSEIVGQSLATIIDHSVWTPGRLVFDGKPIVGSGLTIEPLSPSVHRGKIEVLDISAIEIPPSEEIVDILSKEGMNVRAGSNGLTIAANDLTLSTTIETQDHGHISVHQFLERGYNQKVRCQTPFRESNSFAAFISVNANGIPFVYDSGTGITHWLVDNERKEIKRIKGRHVITKLMQDVKIDGAAALEEDAISALAQLSKDDPAQSQRVRTELKRLNPTVSLSALDRAVKNKAAESEETETHHSFAKSLIVELTLDKWVPVAHHGELYVLNPETRLWERKTSETLVHMVADMHDGKEHCVRSGDYRAIADHVISLSTDNSFFADAPNGLATSDGFFQIRDDQICLVPLEPEHRQRVSLPFKPEKTPTPQFDTFLHDTFQSQHDGEELQQVTLLQEIAGGIMLGILHKYQVAVLFYEPFGRAGKGTLERQLRELVPKGFTTSISPFKWSQDYHVVTLAGKRLNVVGELPENEAIPAAMFKTVLGGDLITGRNPTHRPLTFTNEAAHLFMSNHLITTKDQSEAFFSRWKILEFPNSRLRSGLPLDGNLAQRIIDSELPGIAYWALEGAARLLRNGKLSTSTAHDRLMAKWRRTTNSLEEFIHECCIRSEDATYRRSTLYEDYVEWCSQNGRKGFAKGRVKELLEHNIGMGIRLVELHGYETFRGLGPKKDLESPSRYFAR